MKTILCTLLVSLLLPFSAQALVVENIQQMSYVEPSCPFCAGGRPVTKTIITVSEESCASLEGKLVVKVEDKVFGMSPLSSQTVVTVELKGAEVDCMGPTQRRTYTVETKDLVEGGDYILMNPSRLKLK